jgi:hypothetical protein
MVLTAHALERIRRVLVGGGGGEGAGNCNMPGE